MTEAARKIADSIYDTARAQGVLVHKFAVDELADGWATIRVTIKPKGAKL